MASRIPHQAISAHNEMVFTLDESILPLELEKLNFLLKDDPLTETEIDSIKTVQELFLCLMNKTFISYGDYEKLVPKLHVVKPVLREITDKYTEKINKLLNRNKPLKKLTISMDKPVYQTREGDAAFLTCSVYPKPEEIVWKKDKSAKPSEIVPIDNRKYFYGIEAPTLVIKDPYKILDEAHYQCTAMAHRKTTIGKVVQLQVTAATDVCRTTSSVGPSDVMSQSTTRSEDLNADIRHSATSEDRLQLRHRKRVMSDSDKGCQMTFNITNDIDIKRRKTNNDITETFERVTRCEHGRVETKLQQKCIQVSLNITPAGSPLEPSSVYLAEEFKDFLLNGGTIQLSDESRTVLQIDKNSFEITPLHASESGSPWVNISHSMFVVTVGKTATIQTFIIASPEATSVQWYRVDKDEYIPLQIDNTRYFAGSILSPTLIIRDTIIEDQGEYVCSATNSNGTGWSGIATLTVESVGRNQSTDSNFDPSQNVLKGEDMGVFNESRRSLDNETAEKYVAGNRDSRMVFSEGHQLVAAIDFGTTYSGYAFSTLYDFKIDPVKVSAWTWASGSGGLMSLKTSTCVLFKPDGTFHSFGYEAEDKYSDLDLDDEQGGWRYFRRFKMHLYGNKCLKRSFTIKDDQGQSMQAIEVFTASIRYLKDHMMETCNKQMTGIKPTDILWVLTVPAIWSDASKQFMREAAEAAGITRDRLMIALEPEVASLYCKYLPLVQIGEGGLKTFYPGSKYVLLDAGGGTVDITVHEVQWDGSLKEIHKPSGGDWRSTKVDHAFQLFLSGIVGETAFRQFMENKENVVDFFRNFELKKRLINADVSSDYGIRVSIPSLLDEACRYVNGQSIARMIKENPKFNNIVSTSSGLKMWISTKRAIEWFKDPMNHIVNHLENVLKEPSARDVTSIVMVGGFSESLVLQEEIKRRFPTLRIIIPRDARDAVLKGAVIFGHAPRQITSRICRYTYGVDAVRDFNHKVHDISKRRVLSGERVKCDDIFSTHVQVGDSVDISEQQMARLYAPVEPDQTTMTFNVYTSTERDPMYVTDPGCMKIGQLRISMSDTSRKLDRYIKILISYSNTELQVEVTNSKTGQRLNAVFDYLIA